MRRRDTVANTVVGIVKDAFYVVQFNIIIRRRGRIEKGVNLRPRERLMISSGLSASSEQNSNNYWNSNGLSVSNN